MWTPDVVAISTAVGVVVFFSVIALAGLGRPKSEYPVLARIILWPFVPLALLGTLLGVAILCCVWRPDDR